MTEITMEDGTPAKLGGRFTFEDDGLRQFLKIYYIDEDKPYSSKRGDYVVLTPTSAWAHDMGTDSFKRHAKGRKDGIVVHKDVWDKIRLAEEIENYDPSTNRWISNLDSIDPQPADDLKSADPVPSIENVAVSEEAQPTTSNKEKTKKMSDNSGTLGMISQAAMDGVKLVGANQANEAISTVALRGIKATGVIPDELLDTEGGRLLIKFLGPVMLHWFASTQGEMIDGMITDGSAEKIKKTCELATQAVTAETIEPLLAFLVPLLKGLATGGMDGLINEPAGALGAVEADVVENVVNTTVSEKVAAPA